MTTAPNKKMIMPGPGQKEKNPAAAVKMPAAMNNAFRAGTAAKPLAQPKLFLEAAAGQACFETLPALL